MLQPVTLKFHPTIQKYTNGINEHTVNVNDFVDIKNCLESLFPDLGIHIKRIRAGANRRENLALVNKDKRVIQQEDYFLNRLDRDDTEFYVVPLFIGGGGNGLGMIVLGIALVALVVFTGGTALAPIAGAGLTSMGTVGVTVSTLGAIGGVGIGSMLLGMATSMIISGVMTMLMKPPKPIENPTTTDAESRSENKIFQGLQNTTNSNVPVPIIYGRTRIGGQFISGEIRTIQHGRNETIKVSALFPPGAN